MHERMLDRSKQPGSEEIIAFIGQPLGEQWVLLDAYLREAYEVEPQPDFSPTYGWSFRYRKSRPLCEILPENGSFTVLVVLGGKEAAKALSQMDLLGPTVRTYLENTPPFHDGRWLWIRVQEARDVEDIKRLVALKRKPIQKKSAT